MTKLREYIEKLSDERKEFVSGIYRIYVNKDEDGAVIDVVLNDNSGRIHETFIYDYEDKKYSEATSSKIPENLEELLNLEI